MFKIIGFKLSTKNSKDGCPFEFKELGLTLSHIALIEGTQVNVYVKFPKGFLKDDLMVAVVTKSQPNACLHQLEFPTGSVLYCKGDGVVDCIANLPLKEHCTDTCCEEYEASLPQGSKVEADSLELDSNSDSVSTTSKKEGKDRKKVVKSIEKSPKVEHMVKKATEIKNKEDDVIHPGFKREFSSGLKYEVISISKNIGSNPPQIALAGSKVSVKYEGRLAKTGKKFDSGNLSFIVGSGQVVPGFDQGVKGMIVSETRRVFIPSKLGYGPKGCPPVIPKNADLVFEITLLSTKH
ncbi:peptidyl-prolyl cis-trans isomerase, FKBP-type domain-containing protein [Cryptosporidium felis]|nr:peptidyl-prolyl cis-trans isomerase, FKBP-type domain-containing protein [Cryptosporidium felis]